MRLDSGEDSVGRRFAEDVADEEDEKNDRILLIREILLERDGEKKIVEWKIIEEKIVRERIVEENMVQETLVSRASTTNRSIGDFLSCNHSLRSLSIPPSLAFPMVPRSTTRMEVVFGQTSEVDEERALPSLKLLVTFSGMLPIFQGMTHLSSSGSTSTRQLESVSCRSFFAISSQPRPQGRR